jgi:hypothetical protein
VRVKFDVDHSSFTEGQLCEIVHLSGVNLALASLTLSVDHFPFIVSLDVNICFPHQPVSLHSGWFDAKQA